MGTAEWSRAGFWGGWPIGLDPLCARGKRLPGVWRGRWTLGTGKAATGRFRWGLGSGLATEFL